MNSEHYCFPLFVEIVKKWFEKSNFSRADVENKSEKFTKKREKLIDFLKFAKTFKWNNYSIDLLLMELVKTCE
jgi:hypothetical protein